eukprot:CAMPEP_0197182958 /NCGR_PEP_ID=MMETSP1423-20130617/7137_1 /TAXON_ID=476441 /ORGANISM="Pseudo-nitzschia heimii, Strain UNC1101" /LENGTH=237 /DNA_ID=CAMNT_0042633467 /DNA_START=23 /DNA_END=733 /DNA_ORIENTATION=+
MKFHNKRHIESPQKEFGELFTIHMPDLQSPNNNSLRQDEDSASLQFGLLPELPSHIPTPQTINLGINYRLQTIFTGDDTKPKKRTKREKTLEKSANSTEVEGKPTISLPTSNMNISIASPSSTKWGSDIWNSINVNGPVDSSLSGRKSPFSDSNSTKSNESSNGDDIDDLSLASDKTPQQAQANTKGSPLRRIMTKGPKASPLKPTSKSLTAQRKTVTLSPTSKTIALTPSKANDKW